MSAKKITRKEFLNTPDEFLSFSEKAYIYITDHSKQVLIGVAVFVLVLLAGLGSSLYISSQREKAQAAFNQASSLIPAVTDPSQAELEKAAEGFETFLKTYPGSTPAHYARLELADLYYRLGRYDEARNAYDKFLSSGEAADANFKPFVLDALASAMEMKGDYKNAIAAWQKALDLSGTALKPEALLGIARAQEQLKNNPEARKAYETLIAQYPDSGKTTMAKAKLNSLPE